MTLNITYCIFSCNCLHCLISQSDLWERHKNFSHKFHSFTLTQWLLFTLQSPFFHLPPGGLLDGSNSIRKMAFVRVCWNFYGCWSYQYHIIKISWLPASVGTSQLIMLHNYMRFPQSFYCVASRAPSNLIIVKSCLCTFHLTPIMISLH